MDDRREAEAAAAAREDRAAPDLLDARVHRRVLPKVVMGLALLGVLFFIGNARRPKPPELAVSCSRATFALSAESVKAARPVWYTIVGPDSKRYVLGVNTAAFLSRSDGGYDAVPTRGREDTMVVAAGVKPMKDCRRTGFFSLPIPPGTHEITLYELTPTDAVELERRTIEVTEN